MRLLFKLLRKLLMMVFMVFFMGAVMRYGQRYAFKAAGTPEGPKFSSEETDLMSTVFKSGVKLFTGQASRKELAGELSDKLYAGRDTQTMKELGIEMVSPADSAGGSPDGKPGVANLLPGMSAGKPAASPAPNGQAPNPGAASATPAPAKEPNTPGNPPANGNPLDALNPLAAVNPLSGGKPMADAVNTALLDRVWKQIKANSIEMGLVPVVLLGMFLVQRIRDRRSGEKEFMLPLLGLQTPAESEHYDMRHPVQSLGTEEFELLVALIYQREGYRVSMPAGLSGGRGGDFTLLRKAERILVQCKKTDQDHRVPVERVRELRESMNILGLPRGMYVASCGFTWDARNYGKANGITLINARTLDELIIAARETPDEDLLEVSSWVGKLMSKVQLTPPQCPACEAAMDLVNSSTGSAWLCTQRPDCRGRRLARKYQKASGAAAAAAVKAEPTDTSSQREAPAQKTAPKRSEAVKPSETKKPAASPAPADSPTPRSAAQPAASAAPRSSAIKLAEKITHEDPARQEELHRMAQMARQAIAARRAARAREEASAAQAAAAIEASAPSPAPSTKQEKPASPAPARQAQQTTAAAQTNTGRPTAPAAAPATRTPQTPPSSRPVPATPHNRPAQTPPARQAVPATPGNRPGKAPPASRPVPVTPGNRPEQAPPTRQAVPATPGNRPPQTTPVRKVIPATPGNRPNS